MIKTPEQLDEWLACAESPLHFIHTYCRIEDATAGQWIPFRLWREQAQTIRTINDNPLTVILKARQLGLSWLVLGFGLWLMLFHPTARVLLFSRRDDEAIFLLDDRMKGMYNRLPDWLKADHIVADNDHEWTLSNGSEARAFPTSAGDSYSATLAIVDEADLIPDLNRLMRAVKPTIDAGGRMILLSRSDKTRPQSEFKNIYRGAKLGQSPWTSIFLPWYVRPQRDAAWYAEQMADILARTGSLDDLHEQYPATDSEALSARTQDKRIPPAWIEACYLEQKPVKGTAGAPAISGLEIYLLPQPARRYVIGVDPAEGNPTSDDSALTVMDRLSGEEVAVLSGKFQPAIIASHADKIGKFYNRAEIMVERNNHGHAVLLWLEQNSRLTVLEGHDERPGWNSTKLGKALLYDDLADNFREQSVTVHSFTTQSQIASIEGATLRAPEGELDDRADSFALANAARSAKRPARGVLAQATAKGWNPR